MPISNHLDKKRGLVKKISTLNEKTSRGLFPSDTKKDKKINNIFNIFKKSQYFIIIQLCKSFLAIKKYKSRENEIYGLHNVTNKKPHAIFFRKSLNHKQRYLLKP